MNCMSSLVLWWLRVVSCLKYKSSDNYEYWCTGNCDKPVDTNPHAGLILMGGGTDVDEAFKQQIQWSDCGDFLVIRADRDDKYDKYVYDLDCANSAATVYIKNKDGADDSFVSDIINEAEAIFFAGGDQATYLKDWKDTKLQSAVQNAINNRSVPIGGTSAGCDIQPYFVYSASNGSATSAESLLDPFNEYITFSTYFVNQKYSVLNNTIIDTHFVTRDRFGRLLTFVARLRTHSNVGSVGRDIKGIGINEQTAIAIDLETMIGVTMGPEPYTSEAYILLPDHDPEVCEEGETLTYKDVTVQKLEAYYNDTFDFQTWKGGVKDLNYDVTVENGILRNYPYAPPGDNTGGKRMHGKLKTDAHVF